MAEILAMNLKGRVKLEDVGFDWKILGPDVQNAGTISMQPKYGYRQLFLSFFGVFIRVPKDAIDQLFGRIAEL